jgi:hypothetical protein
VHRRRNGKFFLHVVAHPDFGLPFGQDRLIPIWVATLALRQRSREVYFDSAAQVLDFFHLPKDGPHYRRLAQGFKRLLSATILFGTEEQTHCSRVIDWSRFHFFDGMKLWFNTSESEFGAPNPHENVITVGEAFYREIDAHRIPVERKAVSALAHAPGVLDLYLWLVWKSWTINGHPARIPLVGRGSRQTAWRDRILLGPPLPSQDRNLVIKGHSLLAPMPGCRHRRSPVFDRSLLA